MAKKDKKAKTRVAPDMARRPKTVAPPASVAQGQPKFSFSHADRATSEPWRFAPSGGDATQLVDFMCEMSRLTWAEVERQQTGVKQRRKKHHSQEISTLSDGAKKDIARGKLDETFGDTMFRFRLGGELRLWGFRRGDVFHAVWWDTDHGVYPVDKD